ncbi:hypothetical protein K7432_010694 [Basidiobolus ranarum]|uniref:Uncharacterized protein n=1 Tax=Basidiobolus ranarum TaxID=34480 RepID=A0ABR2VV76_9FUNG
MLTSDKLASLQTQIKRLKVRSAPPPARTVATSNHIQIKPVEEPTDLVNENSALIKTIKNQDKLLLEIREELEKSKQAAQESASRLQECLVQISALENEKLQIKGVNQTLMEENESYQVLLHEKTMNGRFMLNPILQVYPFTISKAIFLFNLPIDDLFVSRIASTL